MAIRSSTQDNITTIRPGDTFDYSEQAEFRKAYESVPKNQQFVIDFRDTRYLDSAALGMLLLLREYAGEEQAKITLVNCDDEVKNIFRISNFNKLFKID